MRREKLLRRLMKGKSGVSRSGNAAFEMAEGRMSEMWRSKATLPKHQGEVIHALSRPPSPKSWSKILLCTRHCVKSHTPLLSHNIFHDHIVQLGRIKERPIQKPIQRKHSNQRRKAKPSQPYNVPLDSNIQSSFGSLGSSGTWGLKNQHYIS
jgi:hypothetical protein